MASEVKEYSDEDPDLKRNVPMQGSGQAFYRLMSLEYNRIIEFWSELIAADNDTKRIRTVTMPGSFTDNFILTFRLLEDDEQHTYVLHYDTSAVVTVTLADNYRG
ncbi:hypothetical protein [Staphylococcus phage vB_SauH_DELF3]|nr:hypothetical protein [Staphylococcus phage vB_SauH_DELF3]